MTAPFCRFERRFTGIDQQETLTVTSVSIVAFSSVLVKRGLVFTLETFARLLEGKAPLTKGR
jgi:hypothetical protein